MNARVAWWVASTILIDSSFFLSFFFLFIISFFANELFMKSIYRSVACNELIVYVCFRVCVSAYVFLHEYVLVGGCSSVRVCS